MDHEQNKGTQPTTFIVGEGRRRLLLPAHTLSSLSRNRAGHYLRSIRWGFGLGVAMLAGIAGLGLLNPKVSFVKIYAGRLQLQPSFSKAVVQQQISAAAEHYRLPLAYPDGGI